MDQNIVLSFIRSTKDIFDTMLQLEVSPGTPSVKSTNKASHDISGIIGFAGEVEGTAVLSFPKATAYRVCDLFTGSDCSESEEDLCDAIGELTNMIAGSAKAQFEGKEVSISCPSVIIGADHVVHSKKGTVCISIPFSSDCGDFAVEFAVKGLGETNATADAATSSAAVSH